MKSRHFHARTGLPGRAACLSAAIGVLALLGQTCAVHAASDCAERFSESLVSSVKWEIFRKVKQEMAYLPGNAEYVEQLVDRVLGDVTLRDFARKVERLSGRARTSVFLLDQSQRCAWLFSSDGTFVHGRFNAWSRDDMDALLGSLGVRMDGAEGVRAPRAAVGGQCPPPDDASRGAITLAPESSDRASKAREALARARDKIVPPEILARLHATADTRLIVVASGGLGIVPFAALPLGEGHFVDKFSIMVAPGAGSLVGAGGLAIDPARMAVFVDSLKQHLLTRREPDRTARGSGIEPPEPSAPERLVELQLRSIANPEAAPAPARAPAPAKASAPKVSAKASDKSKGAKDSEKRSATTLVVGNPDLGWDRQYCWRPLPAAEAEARHVADTFKGATVLYGKQATHARVVAELKRSQASAKYIYFATHGLSDAVNPADGSFLALDGKHMAGAVLRQMKFANAPLVVMSACQTGLGKSFPGGLFGLGQLWFYAGAQKIVMTLWNISDSGTAQLMRIFNEDLQARSPDAIDVDAAEDVLAAAIRKFKGRSPEPATWAGVTVYGAPLQP